jgi:hypothetical protein
MEAIILGGLASTRAVMDWIERNGCPELHAQFFEFPDDVKTREIVVSSVNPDRAILAFYPIEEWHRIKENQRRLMWGRTGWYAKVCEKFYFMSI